MKRGKVTKGQPMAKKQATNQIYMRSVLVGAVLGLYFGFFFRPVRQPNIAFTLTLAFAATVVLVCIQAIRLRPPVLQLFKSAVSIFIKTSLLLLLLDGRHVAYALGGRTATTVYATIAGAIAGLWYAFAQSRAKPREPN